MALLEVKGLRASYGPTRVLHGIDFAIDEGSITAVLGDREVYARRPRCVRCAAW